MDRDELTRRLMATFRQELSEHVQSLGRALLDLERTQGSPEAAPELVNTLFRTAHACKGAARAVGLRPIEQTCHAMETLLAGVRDVDQLARWLTEEPYRKLVTRSNLAARARSARGVPARRPVHAILSVHHSSPADGVVESVVIVQGPARTRAVALRLEGVDGRWRATSLALL